MVANEEEELRLTDPVLGYQMLSEWPADKLHTGMQNEMASMKSFGVYEETTADQLTAAELRGVIKTRWVVTWKGEDVRARLVAKGYTQDVTNVDTYASTPLVCSFKILLLIALSRNWRVRFGDVSTAFLHAKLQENERILGRTTSGVLPEGLQWHQNFMETEACVVWTEDRA